MSAYADLYKEYKKLAKRADERLRTLEKYTSKEGFSDVTRYAYARAQYDIRAFTGDADRAFGRFDVTPAGETVKEKMDMLRTMMASVKTFLNSETSSVGPARGADGQKIAGIKGMYVSRAETTNKEFGTSFTWSNLATYWLSGMGAKMAEMYGSKTALVMIAKHPKKTANILKQIETANRRNRPLSDDQLDIMIELAYGGDISINDL